jgi:hypothetical protein
VLVEMVVAVEMMMNQKVETVVLVVEQTLQVAMEVLLGLVEEM